MVEDGGQLYTIEGVTAGLIMLITAYFVMGSPLIYTPSASHISDMQLEQVGYDVLSAMDTPLQYGEDSELTAYIESDDDEGFRDRFLELVNERNTQASDSICMKAAIKYIVGGVEMSYDFGESGVYTGKQPAVKVSRFARGRLQGLGIERMMLMEVTLWRS